MRRSLESGLLYFRPESARITAGIIDLLDILHAPGNISGQIARNMDKPDYIILSITDRVSRNFREKLVAIFISMLMDEGFDCSLFTKFRNRTLVIRRCTNLIPVMGQLVTTAPNSFPPGHPFDFQQRLVGINYFILAIQDHDAFRDIVKDFVYQIAQLELTAIIFFLHIYRLKA